MNNFIKKTKSTVFLLLVFAVFYCTGLQAQSGLRTRGLTATNHITGTAPAGATSHSGVPICIAPFNLRTFNFTFMWDFSASALYYTLEYKPAAAAAWTVVDVFGTSYTATDVATGTLYDWRVRSNCEKESSEYATAQFYTPAKCATFNNLHVTNNNTGTSVTLNWNLLGDPNDVARILIEYKTRNSSTWINESTNNNASNFNLTGLTPGVIYDWRVRAFCRVADLPGAYAVSEFTSFLICGTPAGLMGESLNTCGDVRVSWNAVSGALGYNVEYKNANSTTWLPLASTTATSIETVLPAGLYNWRVKANCSGGSSIFAESTVQSVVRPRGCNTLRAGKTIAGKEITDAKPLSVFPQPAIDQARISFAAQTTGTAVMEITDMQGKKLMVKNIAAEAGLNEYILNVSQFRNGVYFVRLHKGGLTETVKMVVQQ
jgi:hypothetical protein